MTTSSVIRCGSGGFWAASRKPSIASVHLLIRPVEQVLAGVHDVVRVKSTFDLLHHLEAAAELERHEVDLALAAGAVAGAERAARLDGDAADLPLRVHPGRPALVVPAHLPDADVDLRQEVAPRLESPVRVDENA